LGDFLEIDFLQVNSSRSGDAIAIRYQIGQFWTVHVVDGGYARDAEAIAAHIRTRYGTNRINHMVVTHPDQDHAEGLAALAEICEVDVLWMLRPWAYAPELLPYFAQYSSADRLADRLRSCFPYVDALEKVASRRGIEIREPFQGAQIGAFTVLAPSPLRWAQLVIDSEKTPRPAAASSIFAGRFDLARSAVRFIKAGWGSEKFSAEDTSSENDMSVVQFAWRNGKAAVLTGDVGRGGLLEAATHAAKCGLALPGVNIFQVPHHGGRRNVNSEVLDLWLGPILPALPLPGHELFRAVISASRDDPVHPRKVVRRALLHRGAKLMTTEDATIWVYIGDAPARADYSPLSNNEYPDEQEEDD